MSKSKVLDPKFKFKFLTLKNKKWCYKGEGNANVIIALPEESRVIRVMKDDSDKLRTASEMAKILLMHIDYCKALCQLFFGHYADVPVLMSMSAEELRKIDLYLQQNRPSNRKHKSLSWISGLLTVHPDYTVLPGLVDVGSETVIYCIEIKPKQGWSHEADNMESYPDMCAFCTHQYLKLSRGDIKEISQYCPLDLFSGHNKRVGRAVHNLFQTPQNNLKVFRDGVPFDDSGVGWIAASKAFGFSDSKRFYTFIAACLLGNFEEEHEISDMLDDCMLDNRPRWSCNSNTTPMPEHCVLQKILNMQQMQTTSFLNVCSEYDKQTKSNELSNALQFAHVGHLVSMTTTTNKQSTVLSPIDRYLVAATARDCSVFVTFRQTTHNRNHHDYAVSIKVSDLDPKPISTIQKHQQRNKEVLLACQQYLDQK